MSDVKKKKANSPGHKFFDEQIALLQEGKTDVLVDRNYHDNAVLVSTSSAVRGREELKKRFRDYVTMVGRIEILKLTAFIETEDCILFEATMRTALGESKVYDAFVLSDGKATHHFTGTA